MTTYDLGGTKHVFVDWDIVEPGYGVAWSWDSPVSWEMPHGIQLSVHHPRIDTQAQFGSDTPWDEYIDVMHCSLFEDNGRFRLYYPCWNKGTTKESGDPYSGPSKYMVAYAESTDGVHWDKPTIGTIEFDGSRDNNLVFGMDVAQGRPTLSPMVFKDPNAAPNEAYKLVSRGVDGGVPQIYGAVSPDGLHWTALEEPIISGYFSDTHNTIRYDSRKGKYVGYFRGWSAYERGKVHRRRTIAYAESDSFDRWPSPEPLVAADMHDGPDTDIYTNGHTPWPEADAQLLFPAFYQRATDVIELHMMTSRDGTQWERPLRRPIVPNGEPGSDSEGGFYAAGTELVSLAPREFSLPVAPQPATHNQHLYPEAMSDLPHRGLLWYATWRQDSLMSIEAESEGYFATVPLTFTGGKLKVNCWARFGGEIRVEVVDESEGTMTSKTEAIPGLSFSDCDPITDDHLGRVASWNGESDLSAWSGKPIRLRFQLRRARLYALQFV